MEARKSTPRVKFWRGMTGFPALLAVFVLAELFESIESGAKKVVRALDGAIDAIDAWARR